MAEGPTDETVPLFPVNQGAAALRRQLADNTLVPAPGCVDSLSARILEQSGFQTLFMGGFATAAGRLGLPDVGLLSFAEMLDQARNVCSATSLPVIGDADTGYGNEINAQRTLLACAGAGLACVMIEDQQWPKQCGHTAGKSIVDRAEAIARVRACVRAREAHGLDVLIMARSDAAAVAGFDEALWRVSAFADEGADITFLEAPETTAQMQRYCRETPGWKTANLVEDGHTPWLSPEQLTDIGYSLVLYPVTLLLHQISAVQQAATKLRTGDTSAFRSSFDSARSLLGWESYDAEITDISNQQENDNAET